MAIFKKLFGSRSSKVKSERLSDLNRFDDMSIEETAKMLGVSPEDARQAADQAKAGMRKVQLDDVAATPTAEDVSIQEAVMESVDSANNAAAAATANIWDLEGDSGDGQATAPQPAAASTAVASDDSPRRKRRTKTRLIGFGQNDGQVIDLFGEQDANPVTNTVKFPVGWIAVIDGPGRGEVFALQMGMSQIGRGEDQSVQLDFGDSSISRSNHAAIVYDSETHKFYLGHGGKSNIVRLNDKPLISNEALSNGDTIRLGETTLKFVALCDESFNWGKNNSEGSEDVEIA